MTGVLMALAGSGVRGVTFDPASANGGGTGGTATTDAVTATPFGMTAPYTYAWTFVSGSSFTIDSPSSATTTFTTTLSGPLDVKSGVYRCTVTDTNGVTASGNVSVYFNL